MSNNWLDDTVPTRRVEPGHGEERRSARSGTKSIPARVWVLGFIVALLVLVVVGLWGLYLFRGYLGASGPTPTPIIWTPTPSPTPTSAPSPSPTPEQPTPTVSSDIAIGRYVQVANTGGHGLSLREGPGQNYARMDVALEGETFIVVEGPTLSGGLPWWKIRAPENEEREWWAVGNFLKPIEHP